MILVKEYRGILFSLLLGAVAYVIGMYTPSTLNSVIIALVLGIVAGNLFSIPQSISSGVSFTGNKMLELSILFLAFSINYTHIKELGIGSFVSVAIVLFVIVIFSFYLSRAMKCPGATGWLVGFGTAICGSSAIAALAPGVPKNKEDVAISMAVVNLIGTIGMIFLPLILIQLKLDPGQSGLILGGSLHSVGNVAGAAYSMSPEVGEAAITIKLARVAMLTPGLILYNFMINRKTVKNWKEHFRLPWYLIGFILITILVSIYPVPEHFVDGMDLTGKIVLTVAMAAIGLQVSFMKLIGSGRRGLRFGFVVFLVQLALLGLFLMII